jgi:hypothetical protein
MICSKCIYYAQRSYNLSKCLKFQMFAKDAREIKCKGLSFFPKTDTLGKLNTRSSYAFPLNKK